MTAAPVPYLETTHVTITETERIGLPYEPSSFSWGIDHPWTPKQQVMRAVENMARSDAEEVLTFLLETLGRSSYAGSAFTLPALPISHYLDTEAPKVVEVNTSEDATSSAAYTTFKDLGNWLEASDEEISEAVGIGRTTVYSWHRDGREPRPRTSQKIYEMHAALSSLVQKLGREGLRNWLFGGKSPSSPRQIFLAGDIDRINEVVYPVLFSGVGPDSSLTWRHEPEFNDEPAASYPSEKFKVRKARPKTGRIP